MTVQSDQPLQRGHPCALSVLRSLWEQKQRRTVATALTGGRVRLIDTDRYPCAVSPLYDYPRTRGRMLPPEILLPLLDIGTPFSPVPLQAWRRLRPDRARCNRVRTSDIRVSVRGRASPRVLEEGEAIPSSDNTTRAVFRCCCRSSRHRPRIWVAPKRNRRQF